MIEGMDLFLLFMGTMIVYGFFLKIWKKSKTTLMVMITMFIVGFASKSMSKNELLLLVCFLMAFLFVRAVFRTCFQKVDNGFIRMIFYA